MKNINAKIIFFLPPLILIMIFFVLFYSKASSDVNISISALIEHREPFVVTHPATLIGVDSVNLRGEIVSLGPEAEADVFFQYRDRGSPFWSETSREKITKPGFFNVFLSGLDSSFSYEFRAGVEWKGKQSFGNVLYFTTNKEEIIYPPGYNYLYLTTKIIFQGRAQPLAKVIILKNNEVLVMFEAEKSGLFEKEISGIPDGEYSFSVFLEDQERRKSSVINFVAPILTGKVTEVSGIFLSPTIEVVPQKLSKGGEVFIFGYAFPGSRVKIVLDEKFLFFETKADFQGKWSYRLDTGNLIEKKYQLKAQAILTGGVVSPFSPFAEFYLEKEKMPKCAGADLNFDQKVDIVDFSILLYFWQERNPVNPCADINQDGIVDIVDFSIMMYWWTG